MDLFPTCSVERECSPTHRAYPFPQGCGWEASVLSECGVPDVLTSTLSLLLPGTHISLLCVKLSGVSPAPDSECPWLLTCFSRQRVPHPTCGGTHLMGSQQHQVPKPKPHTHTKKTNLLQICEQLNECQLGLTAGQAFSTASEPEEGTGFSGSY